MLAKVNNDPSNYKEAMLSPEKNKWKEATQSKIKSIRDNQVFELVERPENTNVLNSRWIFIKKGTEKDNILYKARLVIRGYQDENFYEIKDTYAPVSRLPLIRVALSIINKYDLEARQSDVKTAFLNGTLEKAIYMEIPEGYKCDEKDRENKVWKLNKALYGLKISPKRWYQRFTEEATKLGLENDVNEPCLFTWRKEGKFAFEVMYVDDMITAGNDIEKIKEITEHFKKVFEIKEMGEPENFLGMNIKRNREKREMIISQPDYIEKILERFKMKECYPQDSPMVTRQVDK